MLRCTGPALIRVDTTSGPTTLFLPLRPASSPPARPLLLSQLLTALSGLGVGWALINFGLPALTSRLQLPQWASVSQDDDEEAGSSSSSSGSKGGRKGRRSGSSSTAKKESEQVVEAMVIEENELRAFDEQLKAREEFKRYNGTRSSSRSTGSGGGGKGSTTGGTRL